MRAVLGGHSRCVRALVGARCDVNAADDDGVTPLAAAVAVDHDDAAKIIIAALLDAGADPTRADVRGVVPTQLAAAGGKVEALKLLLAGGAGVNTGSVFSTPLHDAAFMSKVKCLRVLLENGADASARDRDGRTATDRARGGDYEACVEALVERGAANFTVLE
uniref:Ankyrin repeat protein n=1 Tax=Micromonas pusilla TaxID=38833 RepID=A0A7S0IJK8_MICPS|mmetsp:Transcript_809/g.3129  ORF Transcript_809/g.3129 Transcript_809/m.3129 type:complete len:163 (+) Transcript_809:407-895(+)